MSALRNLKSRYGEWDPKESVYHVESPHVLIQAAGYLKYKLGTEGAGGGDPLGVFYRGQAARYAELRPGLFRGIRSVATKEKREKAMGRYLDRLHVEDKVMRDVHGDFREPLLQHYGIRTTWLDVVDNIWVALWFACHAAHTSGDAGDHLHFERRSLRPRPGSGPDDVPYCYILLIKAGIRPVPHAHSGYYTGGGTELVDLRLAIPSFFIRPHTQHGLLMRSADRSQVDYSPHVAGIIRVRLADALEWIGDGKLLTIHSLFPPPFYDFGFGQLLKHAPPGNNMVGSIQVVGA